MKKLVHGLTLVLVLVLFCNIAFAAMYSGRCGENARWNLKTTAYLMKATGTGAVTLGEWEEHMDFIGFITLADGLTSIESYTFSNLPVLEEIVIPASVTEIGEGALANCPLLKRVIVQNPALVLPENLLNNSPEAVIICTEGSETAQNAMNLGYTVEFAAE